MTLQGGYGPVLLNQCHSLTTSSPQLIGVVQRDCVFAVVLQLLSTVDASTGDVCGLQDKLDRKKKVTLFKRNTVAE